MSEEEIVRGINCGDMLCYEKLIELYSSYVVRVIIKVSSGKLQTAEIEELSADIFIKIWQKKLDIEEGKLKFYIGAIARNHTLNYLKGRGRRETIPLEEDTIDYETPEDSLVQEEDKKLVIEALNTLPEPDREIFIRRYFYMEKIIDIAENLKLNVQTVGTKLFRGKKKLEKALKERGVTYE